MAVGLLMIQFLPLYSEAQPIPQKIPIIIDSADLTACIRYAIQHKPIIQQSLVDEATTQYAIKSKLADWYPQINADYAVQHNFKLATSYNAGNFIQFGTLNTSTAQFSVTQNLFTRDLLLAGKSQKTVEEQAANNTVTSKIQIVAQVSKAYFDVVLTQKQATILSQTIGRLQTSYTDAYNRYKGGIADNIDYKQAAIALNNAKSQWKSLQEQLNVKYATLKNAMGYATNSPLKLVFDNGLLQSGLIVDTLQGPQYQNRIEYKTLQTQKKIQAFNLDYAKWSYYPNVSAFGSYNLNFLDNDFGKLYGHNYPNSFAGVRMSLPIFQGKKRIYQQRIAALAIKRTDWDLLQIQLSINAQYQQALAVYKSYLYDYQLQQENLQLAKEVYSTIQLQYKSGIKRFLDVIVAETDLRNAEINFTNVSYQLLSAKVDVDVALGNIVAP